jgi:hypothetical protein
MLRPLPCRLMCSLGLVVVLAAPTPARAQDWEVSADATGDVSAEGSTPAAPAPAPPASSVPSDYDARADADPSALTVFRNDLDPNGDWEDDPTYGTVWVPHRTVVGADFAPYVTAGHWALDESGAWLWVSDYSWGWGPFHYGRWVWISARGWAWIPGRVYAPAWVSWRTGYYDDYYVGWAPMPPSWYWWGGVAVGLAVVPPAPYVFCSSSHVFYPRVHGYIVPAGRVALIAPRTRVFTAAAPYATGGYRTAVVPRGPSIAEAHVPARVIPAARVAPPARAWQLARTAPQARTFAAPSASPQVRTFAAPSVAPSVRPYSTPSVAPAARPYSAPSPAPALAPKKRVRARVR